MDELTFETCWAVNGEIIKRVTLSWSSLFNYQDDARSNKLKIIIIIIIITAAAAATTTTTTTKIYGVIVVGCTSNDGNLSSSSSDSVHECAGSKRDMQTHRTVSLRPLPSIHEVRNHASPRPAEGPIWFLLCGFSPKAVWRLMPWNGSINMNPSKTFDMKSLLSLSVWIAQWLGNGLIEQGFGVRLQAGAKCFSAFSRASGLALGPTQSPIHWITRAFILWVKRPGLETIYLPVMSR